MKCEQFRNDVEALLAGELDKATAEAMRNHAGECCECAQLMKSIEELTDLVKAIGMQSMPASLESRIRSLIEAESSTRPRLLARFTRRRWALAATVLVALVAGALLLSRQPQVTAASIVARAKSTLQGISSYHVKYKSILRSPEGEEQVTYSEHWYQAPRKARLEFSQNGGTTVNIIRGKIAWGYRKGSRVAEMSMISDSLVQREVSRPVLPRSPEEMLDELGDGSSYLGNERVNNRQCAVIEQTTPHYHLRAYIDLSTGFMVKDVSELSETNYVDSGEALSLSVNQPIPDATFKPNLPPNALIYKSVDTNGLFSELDSNGKLPERFGVGFFESGGLTRSSMSEGLQQFAVEGKSHKMRLQSVLEPRYIPPGYSFVAVERRYITHGGNVLIDYVNPHTGGTLVIAESADPMERPRGDRVAWGDTQGQVVAKSDPFPYVELFWKSGDACLSVKATLVTKEEAIKVAKSMRLFVPGTVLPESGDPALRGLSWTDLVIDKGTSPNKVDHAIAVLKKRLKAAGLQDVNITKLPSNLLRVETRNVADGGKWMGAVMDACDGLPLR